MSDQLSTAAEAKDPAEQTVHVIDEKAEVKYNAQFLLTRAKLNPS